MSYKIIKKIIAVISAAAIILASGIPVSAMTEVNGTHVVCPFPASVYPSDESSSAEHYKMQNATYTSKSNPNVRYVVTTQEEAYAMVMNANSDKNGGTKSLRLYGKGTNIENTNTAVKVSFLFGEQTLDDKYVVSFDARRVYKDWRDYAALNEGGSDDFARFDSGNTQWKVTSIGKGYDAGYNVGSWSRYEAELSTVYAPQLDFSVSEWGVIYIDNIIVKDTSGNVIFKEDFEFDEANLEEPEEPSYMLGDADGDGEITVKDVIAIRRHIAGGYGVEVNADAADTNADNKVDVKDVVAIRRFITGGYGESLPETPVENKRNFILGTDWWTDCDDAVAVRILARAYNDGKINLKGIGINACMEYSVQSLAGFLNSEGISDIPIGIDLAATDFGGSPQYQERLSKLPSDYDSNADAENAVKLYRRILAESKEPLEIIEIGYLQVIAEVIKSKPDEISSKTGLELIQEKVSKIWVMAGKWDEYGGKENNFARNERARSAASSFCERCPVPITFLGYEVGVDVITGNKLNKDDILYGVLSDHGSSGGRSSWDPMLVQMAIIGDEATAGYDVVQGEAYVNSATGENIFRTNANGRHKYVARKMPVEYYQKQINDLID